MKSWLFALLVLLVAVAGVRWIAVHRAHSKAIKVFHTSRPSMWMMRSRRAGTAPLTFGLDSRWRLTEIKVVALAEWQTNQFASPLWHLVSDSNSAPVSAFTYGQRIRGMRPEVDGAQAKPLDPGTTYRLFIAAGNVSGQHDFDAR
ncbi:MAG: hypothetical protein ABSE16_10535 [Verrucomicrobiota bacterium]